MIMQIRKYKPIVEICLENSVTYIIMCIHWHEISTTKIHAKFITITLSITMYILFLLIIPTLHTIGNNNDDIHKI